MPIDNFSRWESTLMGTLVWVYYNSDFKYK